MSESDNVSRIPLSPQRAAELIIELYGDKEPVRRNDIVEPVIAEWKKRGGLDPNEDRYETIRKATQQLKARHLAYNNMGSPMWQIYSSPYSPIEHSDQTAIDRGGCAYAYWYPMYEKHAKDNQEENWRIKIGFTADDVAVRVRDQLGTSTPEMPEIITLSTDHGQAWERVLHGCLDLVGRRIEDTPGSEWYKTNPDELREIMEFIKSRKNDKEK
ncbi:MAG: GIY-YIG nuclease family protein [Gammaproteobacteria bacterium]|nr:GIY-YIG nuclease family protein [Gammaproteobacteria bacterium]